MMLFWQTADGKRQTENTKGSGQKAVGSESRLCRDEYNVLAFGSISFSFSAFMFAFCLASLLAFGSISFPFRLSCVCRLPSADFFTAYCLLPSALCPACLLAYGS